MTNRDILILLGLTEIASQCMEKLMSLGISLMSVIKIK